MLIVLTTTPGFSEGPKLAEELVNAKLAACVQIIPQITSVYVWEGKTEKENEQLLLIKTSEEKYAELEDLIRKLHTYEVPEIVAIDPAHVSQPYRGWLESTLSK
jgi:periplasmic divalent cation tolerance protein